MGRWGGFGGHVEGLEGARENGLDDSRAWLRSKLGGTLAPCLGEEAVTAFCSNPQSTTGSSNKSANGSLIICLCSLTGQFLDNALFLPTLRGDLGWQGSVKQQA